MHNPVAKCRHNCHATQQGIAIASLSNGRHRPFFMHLTPGAQQDALDLKGRGQWGLQTTSIDQQGIDHLGHWTII